MKRTLLLVLGFVLTTTLLFGQDKRKDKAAETEKEFQDTYALIESKAFKVEIDKVMPISEFDISRFNPTGSFIVYDTIAQGKLPFFGVAYRVEYGEGGGIEFDNKIIDEKIKIKKRRKHKLIVYEFSVKSRDDVFDIYMEIFANKNCTLNVNSNNRRHISFSANVKELEEEDLNIIKERQEANKNKAEKAEKVEKVEKNKSHNN